MTAIAPVPHTEGTSAPVPHTLGDLVATDEQAAILEWATAHPEVNLLVNALAGAAKTSTLQFLAKYLPAQPTLSLAFNKRIAEEMGRRLPAHVVCATMNSVGHRTWSHAIGKKLVVDTKKTYSIVKGLIDALPRSERASAYESFSDITKAISSAKIGGYIPAGSGASPPGLVQADEFYGSLDEAPDRWFIRIVDHALREGIRQAYAGAIDFDDQIYMPTLFGGSFPSYPRIMVDEAQDLNPLNHAMLGRLVRPSTQLIAVGDPNQSIYAFRGAVTNSMTALCARFAMHEMNLSVSFRCAQAIVLNARSRAPHMRWAPEAPAGRVEALTEWNHHDIPDAAAIICRNNAPLLSAALMLLRSGRGVNLVGTDLGPQLVRALKRLGPEALTQPEVLHAIDQWEADKLAKTRNPATVTDKAECLRVFASFGPTLSAAIGYAEHIFAAKGPIQLLSGHKSKGLEWDACYILDPFRCPSPWAKTREAIEQELNLKYVMETRARRELYFIRLEDFVDATRNNQVRPADGKVLLESPHPGANNGE